MLNWVKSLVRRYDQWCEELGLTPENKRSCVPHRTDPTNNADGETSNTKAEQPNGKHHD